MSDTASPLRDTKQAAARLGLAEQTLNRWRVEGRGPRWSKIGRLVKYRDCDIDAFIAAQSRTSTSQAA